jgi:4-hydroxyproline betaine 2-epimerase
VGGAAAISLGLCDGFGLEVTRLGGLGAMATVRDVCVARSLPPTCDDSWGGDLIAAARVHDAATVHPRLLEGVWIADPYVDLHDDSAHPARVEGGRIRVPTGPGLGVVPDDGALGDPAASFAQISSALPGCGARRARPRGAGAAHL